MDLEAQLIHVNLSQLPEMFEYLTTAQIKGHTEVTQCPCLILHVYSLLWPHSHSAHHSGLNPILLITLASSHSAHHSGLNPILLITLASIPFCSSLWPQSHSAHHSGLNPILLITLASIPFCSSLWPQSHSAHHSGPHSHSIHLFPFWLYPYST